MRILLVSDIHANLVALEAVLRDAEREAAIDGVWSTGDSVGYGPQPSECVARLRGLSAVMVAGNHERAATGAIGTDDFNPNAAIAARWTMQQLDDDEGAFLDSLPMVALQRNFTLVHGTLRDPIWEYMDAYHIALGHLALQQTAFGVFGHTHRPMVIREDRKSPHGCEFYKFEAGATVPLDVSDQKVVFNPGSVGQPRDGDRRASYAIYDTDEGAITLYRVEYDFGATQRLMEDAGLPRWLIERLSEGR